ncbi:hypothetical protein SRB17_81300 [Streptomyces sp. RB17]|uniref:hypothetical protein n=1 Tax=Streptomyces sp. RB17 TaxID=2585197 RepID=UPI0012966907|nr:hypothetical protein [Streptomyces sp. RB17]MQY40100.1 hypothetical protein [Streptomyces sp. RB17]
MGLYRETHIRADLDELWARTQDPVTRLRWDLRFTSIAPLPGVAGEPRRFTCTWRVLPLFTVPGTGVAAGERDRPDGTRVCALRFSSAHPLSPVAEASAYWRYVPDAQGVRLLTGYEYRARGGAFGAVADRLLLRPLTGWATGWSFDRLRLWLERGITPERALVNWIVELAVRAVVLTVCLTGLGLQSLMRLFGSFADTVAYLCPLVLVVAGSLAVFKAPSAGTPAARRCLRAPVTQARTPRVLRRLEAVPVT